MLSLREYVADALKKHVAIAISTSPLWTAFWAVADAAQALKVPVIIGVSEGERDYVGVREAVAIVKSIREERGQAIFLNADHNLSFERVKEAIDAGFDSVIFDGSAIAIGREHKDNEEVRGIRPIAEVRFGNDILIEGELGYIGRSSEVMAAVPAGSAIDRSGRCQTPRR